MQKHAWIEIDLKRYRHNLSKAKALVGGSQLCVVMKANAYGLGIENLLPTVIEQQVPYIAIADNQELLTIAQHQPRYHGQVMRVRTATAEEVLEAMPLGIEEIIGHLDNAKIINQCAQSLQTIAPYHLKLNSAGMGRNGLDLSTEDGRQQARAILQLPHLKVVGLMTHFPKDTPQDLQSSLTTFNHDCEWVINEGKLDRQNLCIHAANTYATLVEPAARLDMVRPGSLFYADTSMIEAHGFLPAFAFKSRIASINRYQKGDSISYEREHILERDSDVATVLVGYADGYRRAFSHQGAMLVRGQRAPVIGRVSMNVTTVDVTDIEGAAIGDEVVIYGQQGEQRITQDEMEDINNALFADLYTVWGRCNPTVLK